MYYTECLHKYLCFFEISNISVSICVSLNEDVLDLLYASDALVSIYILECPSIYETVLVHFEYRMDIQIYVFLYTRILCFFLYEKDTHISVYILKSLSIYAIDRGYV